MKTPKRITALTSSVIAAALLFSAVDPAVAATDIWTGATDFTWLAPGNWTGGNAPPIAGDALLFSGAANGSPLNNNLASGIAIDGIYFSGGPYTFTGNNVLLSGAVSNTVGVLNISGQAQTFSTMPLTLDWGYYTISSPSGGGLALNAGVTLSTGSVAYFDTISTSSSLSLDTTTGLINGLEGSALIYDGGFTPTGLATISGGGIQAFTAYVNVATPNAIPNLATNNLNLTATGVNGTYTAASGTSVNTITVAQAGGVGGAFLTTLTPAGTLTLGANGGIYVLNPTGTNHGDFSLAGGTLTAGTSGPGTIVFAINGANANNQASVTSTIVNNAGGGAVTVIKTGPGSMNFATTTTSSYSGGVYVDQGQLQFAQPAELGTGPTYVSSAGTLYYTGTAAVTNNIFLSPGGGATTYGSAAVAGGAGLIASASAANFSGTLTLQGPPVAPPGGGTITTPTGDTFSGDLSSGGGNYTFSGQITGTGTLEITGAHTSNILLDNTNTVNTNNWQGGLLIGGHGGVAANIDVKLQATNQIPSGTNAGNITLLPSTGAVFARLDLNGNNTTINGISATTSFAPAEASLGNFGTTSCTLTLGAGNATATYNGLVTDGGSAKSMSLVKIGNGTQTFGGTLSVAGSVTVQAGDVALTGTASPTNAPVVTVASGATLDGSGLSGGGLTVGASQTLNCVGTVVGNTTVNGTVMALDAIGTFTNNNGTMSFNGGGTFVWDINNAIGSPGGDTGWSQVNVQNGSLQINANSGSPFNINITSLTSADVPGSAANFNPNASGSWIIAAATGGISGFTGANQFTINTAAFANSPASSSKWSVGVSGNNLVLSYTAVTTITTTLVNQTNAAGSTATFTVVANNATAPVTFNWLQGSNPLNNGGTSAGGGAVTITTNIKSSTLTIANVQDADAGGITVNVSDNFSDSGSSSATLSIIDPPVSPSITQSLSTNSYGGGLTELTASAGGTQPFVYEWFLNGVLITNNGALGGSSSSNLYVGHGAAQSGTYTVVIANLAGSATNTFVLPPVTAVPGQIIYEPFTSYVAQTFPPGGADTWENMTNLYNQITDTPAWWFHSSGSGVQMIVQQNDLANGANNSQGGTYPWPGLAGDSTNILYWAESLNSHLEFGQSETFAPGTKVYMSFLMSLATLGSANGTEDVLAGFTTSDSGTAFNLKICSVVTNFSANQISLGIAKANGIGATQGVDANTVWTGPLNVPQVMLVVACYTVVSGGNTATDDTVSLWINPGSNTFYASEANVPAPTLGPLSFGVSNSIIRDFAVHSTTAPGSHRIADLRVGTTWASVTPPSAPTLYLGNVYAPLGTTAVLASQNAGNPATGYSWQFNNGSPLSNGATGHGSSLSGANTATLTISNVQSGDLGTYTVTATNTDPSPSDGGVTLTGSASGLLTTQPPKLHVVYSAPDAIVLWPTNWLGYVLEQSPSVAPSSWTTNSLPPYPVVGTNNGVSVPASGVQFFRLINP